MTQTEALKPCQHCESERLRVAFLRATDEVKFWCVECRDCYASGPHKDTEAEAITAWNTRPSGTQTPTPLAADEQIEAVARALAKADGKDPDAQAWARFPGGHPYGICWRDQYAKKAEAAIAALSAMQPGEGVRRGTLDQVEKILLRHGIVDRDSGFENYGALWDEIRALSQAPIDQVGVAPDDEEAARKLYQAETDNHPTIHSNRFPTWDELTPAERRKYFTRAALTSEQGR